MFRKGDRVKHPVKSEWGVGEVLEDECAGRVSIYFGRLGDARTLSLEHVSPLSVSGEEADDPLLRNLTLSTERPRRVATLPSSLPEAVSKFLSDYPGGFYSERYQEQERRYKDAAVAFMDEQLGEGALGNLLADEQWEEIGTRARRVVSKTNLVFPNEAMALSDALKDPANARQFAESLGELLSDDGGAQQRFEKFAACLEDLDAAKWTIASYFQFLKWPQTHVFVKPTITRDVAALFSKEIAYRPELNWATYSAVQSMARDLRQAIEREGLAPRDMVDVQSFMWCVANRME